MFGLLKLIFAPALWLLGGIWHALSAFMYLIGVGLVIMLIFWISVIVVFI